MTAYDADIAADLGRVFSEDEIAAAVQNASIPVLLMVVYQVTGDRAWLSERFRPRRGKGLGARATGGLSAEAQREVRQAAVPAVLSLLGGQPPNVVDPDARSTAELVSFFLGEAVPDRYGPILKEEIDRRMSATGEASPLDLATPPSGLRCLIIGTGIAGIAAIRMMQQLGLDYTVVEREPDAGGVWQQNTYPGAGVDTPSHLYSFSFSYRDWDNYFALRDELFGYFNGVLDELNARDRVRFDTEVISATYDDQSLRWTVTTRHGDGSTHQELADIVISAVGSLNEPRLPTFPGMQKFSGTQFHSNFWPENLDLQDKRVAVVGAGASSQQLAPEIAPLVEHLTVIQRSPQWVAPFEQFREAVPEPQRTLLAAVPLYRAWYWVELFWQFGDKIIEALRIDPEWEHPERSVNSRNDGHRQFFTKYIADKLAGRPDLIQKSTPDYPPFGKRMLLDNGWYEMLMRDNVSLVAGAVSEVDETGIVCADGEHIDADVIVWATGFKASHFLSSLDVRGEHGVRLRELWGEDDPRAYVGVSIPHFPNFFMLGGPHSLPGSGSFMYFMELQVRYLRDLLTEMFRDGITAIDAKDAATDRYNDLVDDMHGRTVWSHPGFQTYYRNSKGRVIFVMPFLNVEYWEMVRQPDLDNYEHHRRRDTLTHSTAGRHAAST